MNYEQPIEFSLCERCGENSYESLASHGYCLNCNYSRTEDDIADDAEESASIPRWALEALAEKNDCPVSNTSTQRFLDELEPISA